MSLYLLYKTVCWMLIITCVVEIIVSFYMIKYKKKHFENVEKQNEILKHQNQVMYNVLFTEKKEDAKNDD